jgi:hypothetical protein
MKTQRESVDILEHKHTRILKSINRGETAKVVIEQRAKVIWCSTSNLIHRVWIQSNIEALRIYPRDA